MDVDACIGGHRQSLCMGVTTINTTTAIAITITISA